jgi:hypothetical protein
MIFTSVILADTVLRGFNLLHLMTIARMDSFLKMIVGNKMARIEPE